MIACTRLAQEEASPHPNRDQRWAHETPSLGERYWQSVAAGGEESQVSAGIWPCAPVDGPTHGHKGALSGLGEWEAKSM